MPEPHDIHEALKILLTFFKFLKSTQTCRACKIVWLCKAQEIPNHCKIPTHTFSNKTQSVKRC